MTDRATIHAMLFAYRWKQDQLRFPIREDIWSGMPWCVGFALFTLAAMLVFLIAHEEIDWTRPDIIVLAAPSSLILAIGWTFSKLAGHAIVDKRARQIQLRKRTISVDEIRDLQVTSSSVAAPKGGTSERWAVVLSLKSDHLAPSGDPNPTEKLFTTMSM